MDIPKSEQNRVGEADRENKILEADRLVGDRDRKALQAYGQVLAERNYIDDRLRDTLKELSDIKFALDRSAIVAITDARGVIDYVNQKFCELSQYSREELLGSTHQIINSGYHSPEFFKEFWLTIRSGQVWKGQIKNKAKDGSFYWVDTTIVPFLDDNKKPYQYLAIRYDITERKLAEESLQERTRQLEATIQNLKLTQSQLVQTEKMSSLGQLVAGVAHEINNPVSFIYGNLTHTTEYVEILLNLLRLYQQHYPNPAHEIQVATQEGDLDFLMEDLPKMLVSMKMGSNRIREIVLSLRNFSRHDEAAMKPVDIHEGIDSTLLILQHQLKAKGEFAEVSLIKQYGNLPLVECYPSQLNQVFMNLIANAIDALEEGRKRPQENDESQEEFYPRCPTPRIRIQTQLVNENQVTIEIADNGIGIKPEAMQHLFDPFFTTKPVGKGTGLGLSIAYHIVVEKHQGELKCLSYPCQGTQFLVSIPISQQKQLESGFRKKTYTE